MAEALIVIDGVEFPAPDEYKVEVEPVGSFERNANGFLVGDLLDVKVKVSCSWGMLENRYYKKLLDACRLFFVNARFYDPRKGDYCNSQMYVSPQSGKLSLNNGSEIWWSKASFSLMER